MFKRIFRFSYEGEPAVHNGAQTNGTGNHAVTLAEPNEEIEPATLATAEPAPKNRNRKAVAEPVGAERNALSFDQIYQAAAVSSPQTGYGILKVAEMVNSPHLEGLSPDAKRCSLRMALEAVGAKMEELLQDAIVRQRALNNYEAIRQQKLQEFEAAKAEANSKLQEDLGRLTTDYMSMMQANLDEVAREQDDFRAWQKRKQQESQRIAEAAAFCVPAEAHSGSLTAVLERATASLK